MEGRADQPEREELQRLVEPVAVAETSQDRPRTTDTTPRMGPRRLLFPVEREEESPAPMASLPEPTASEETPSSSPTLPAAGPAASAGWVPAERTAVAEVGLEVPGHASAITGRTGPRRQQRPALPAAQAEPAETETRLRVAPASQVLPAKWGRPGLLAAEEEQEELAAAADPGARPAGRVVPVELAVQARTVSSLWSGWSSHGEVCADRERTGLEHRRR